MRPKIVEPIVETVLALLLCGILIGPGIIIWQGFKWLQLGQWISIPVSSVLIEFDIPYPDTKWSGIQTIMEWILDFPLSLTFFFLSLALYGSVLLAYEGSNERKRSASK